METNVTRRGFIASAALGTTALGGMAAAATQAHAGEATDTDIVWNGLYDVVVIGFGGAGAVAAITAAEAGAQVLLVDKAPKGHEGGNTRYCMQVINTIPADKQAEALEYYQKLRGTRMTPSDEMLTSWISKVTENVSWLQERGGNPLPLYDTYPGEYPEYDPAGSIVPMTLEGVTFDSGFWKFVNGLVMDHADQIDVWYSCPATDLIRDSETGVVLGATFEVDGSPVNVRAKSGVVLACGGFEANQQMIQDYLGLTECYADGSQYNTGDGIKMASAIGADLWHMENVMGPYLGTYYPGMSRPEFYSGTRAVGLIYREAYIIVAGDGTRFMNDAFEPRHGYIDFHGTWKHTPAPDGMWLVFDQACLDNTRMISQSMARDLSKQVEMGVVKQADTIEELAEQMGVDASALRATVDTYNDACANGFDPIFNRAAETLVAFTESGPYYATELKPTMINTQGGPVRDSQARILDKNGEPIAHLFGAGECGAMFSGPYQGASNIADDIAMGRVAGENAAAAKDDGPATDGLTIETVVPAPVEEPAYDTADNQYIAAKDGICGPITVRVTVDGDKVAQVEVLNNMETDTFGGRAIASLPAKFEGLTANEVMDVDTVTFATITSSALKLAVVDALDQAAQA